MAKLTLNDITSGYLSADAYNENNALIEAVIDNTLSRDGTTPNTMSADFDMNSFDINNVAVLNATTGNFSALTLNGSAITTSTTLTGGLLASEVTYDGGDLDTKLGTDFIKTTGVQSKAGALTLSDALTVSADTTVTGRLVSQRVIFDNTRLSADGYGSGRIQYTSNGSSPYNQFLGRNIEEDTGTGALEYGRVGDGAVLVGFLTDTVDGDFVVAVGPSGVAAGTPMYGTASSQARLSLQSGVSPQFQIDIDGNSDLANFNASGMNLASGKGILFSGSSQRFSDYKADVYTPTMTVNSGSVTLSSTLDTLAYTKVGRLVHIMGRIRVGSVSTPSGVLQMSVPFAFDDLAEESEACNSPVYVKQAVTVARGYTLMINDTGSGSSANIEIVATGGSAGGEMQANTELYFNFSYYTSA